DPTEKTGHVSIDIKGTLLTEYNYSNPFQRAFWWFYSHAFYNKQRTAYIEEGKDHIYEIRDKFQELLGISPATQ
ncbi:hypothetical protein HY501_02775, partial [Candidatus Woesearchaeota archaeon]|nr:hypothetical protein [Candidatus Woesearchaeota archaeon]